MESFIWEVTNLLNAGINVLAYYGKSQLGCNSFSVGDLDLVCPWNGGINWMLNTPWAHQEAFGKAPMLPWRINGVAVGESKQFKNFQFLKVYDAGHMTPTDQPSVSLELFTNFLYHIPFNG